MKMFIVVALALAAVAVAAPTDKEPVKILRADFQQQPEGGFQSSFETENGIKQEVVGELKEVIDEEKKPQTVVVLRGSYSYTDPEGTPVFITYFADETGFHAEGDAIPKAPVARR